ncbi:MAG: M36 family metallopeptidase [Gammaproteobacteria bacterium]|nr:M36 family metallopeptidase [Gammaproteobacteria bacterium]
MQKPFTALIAVALAAAGASATPRVNFDAEGSALLQRAQQQLPPARPSAALLATQIKRRLTFKRGDGNALDRTMGVDTVVWISAAQRAQALQLAHAGNIAAATVTKPSGQAATVARAALAVVSNLLRVDRNAIDRALVLDVADRGRGPIVVRFAQMSGGLPVFGRRLNVLLDRKLAPVAVSGYFAPSPATLAPAAAPTFSLGATQALARAFADMGGKLVTAAVGAGSFVVAGSASDLALYRPAASGSDFHPVGQQAARKGLYYLDGRYLPVWQVVVHGQTIDRGTTRMYGYLVAADDGRVLRRVDLTAEDAFGYRVFAAGSAPHEFSDEPIGIAAADDYDPLPNPSPTGNYPRTQAPRVLNTLINVLGALAPQSPAAGDPWLPSGATTTAGNNVVDFLNPDGVDGFQPGNGDVMGAISSAGTFDYPYAIDSDPQTTAQQQAAIVNQFYVDNWLHDFWYVHGMDEAAGNAQQSNFGRGGKEGDPILAQAQDGSGRNNANMSTPPDGMSPTQRMFLWDGLVTGALTITNPSAIGPLPFGYAAFGPGSYDVTGALVLETDSDGTNDGCQGATNASALAGKIALIDRGACTFVTKTRTAQSAGAIGVLIANNDGGTDTIVMADDGTGGNITIPAMMASNQDGDRLKQALAAGAVSLEMKLTKGADEDGTMDNQIIAHEFFHYISNRLVGDGFGLGNQQGGGMGEGWSDFDALLQTVRADDVNVPGNDRFQGVYALSNYVLFNPYFGIRRYPYSTDMTINPLTFKDIQDGVPLPAGPPVAFGADGADNSEVHNTGEVWAEMLWEAYASLLNDGRYSFDQAKSRMADYVIQGLMMTPDNPTFVEARDGILAAVKATDAGDYADFTQAFAKRGLGAGAIAPDRNDPGNHGAVESFIAQAAGIEVTDGSLSLADADTGVTGSDCDGDGILDVGDVAKLTLTITNNGNQALAAGAVSAAFSSDGSTRFTPATVPVPAIAAGGTTTISTLVQITQATQAQLLTLSVAFPNATSQENGVIASGSQTQIHVDYNETPSATSDDVEDLLANSHDWTLDPDDASGWSVADGSSLFSTGNLWFGPDNGFASDIRLVTPEFDVGTSDFTLAFDHFFSFETSGQFPDGSFLGFDGGVLEVSTDGGRTWRDAFTAIGATVTQGTGYNGRALVFNPGAQTEAEVPPAFVFTNEPTTTQLEHVVVDFGIRLASQKVLLRFRVGSDAAVGDFGWVVDNIAVSGVTNQPFSKTVADGGACANLMPVANAGADQSLRAGSAVTLDGSASADPTQRPLVFSWVQTAGPKVTLSGADTAKPTFTATQAGTYGFTLTVNNGVNNATDSVNVTANKSGGAAGFGLLLPLAAAAALRRRKPRNGDHR